MKFSPTERKLLQDPGIFIAKYRVIQKVTGIYASLKKAIHRETRDWNWIAPPDFDPTRFKIARGENLEGFPYQYLDCPQYFSNPDKLTFRTIFWWGNYIVSSVILEGRNLPVYQDNLLRIRASLDRFYLTRRGTMWEWNRSRDQEIQITGNKRSIETVITTSQFIKITWYLEFKQFFNPRFQFISFQLDQFRKLKPVITRSN